MSTTSETADKSKTEPTSGDGGFDHVEKLDTQQASGVEVFDDSIEDTRPSKAVWLITITVAMGGFLFGKPWGTPYQLTWTMILIIATGYDTGVISAVLVSLKDDLGHELSSKEQELVTSITSGGALIGAVIAGVPADRYGRKLGIYIGCILFFIGSVIQAAAYSVAQMTVGRFIVGLGVGSAAMIIVSTVPMFNVTRRTNNE